MTALVVAGVYLLVLVAIGAISSRRGANSAEDYFLAGRSFGTVVLFMALFGTNVTAFALLGLPGRAYHAGVGAFGFFGASAAMWGILVFVLLGYPIWRAGKIGGYLTPPQMFADRWSSPAVGHLVLVLMLLYTVPYVVIGIMGGGIAIAQLSDGLISYEFAAVIITGVTVFYTSAGGMRGTAWTNVFQASVFLLFLVVACIGVAGKAGGAAVLVEQLRLERPDLLGNNFPPAKWATACLVGPVSIIAFPHMFMRLLAARDASSLRRTIQLYPWALTLLFVPVTLLGVWGAVLEPGLVGKGSDRIVPLLVADYLPPALSAVGLAAILAAVMSSLDGQLLTVSTLLSVDVFHRAGDANARRWGRFCVLGVALVALLAALLKPSAIFSISVYAFSGYTLIVPLIVCAFFVPRVSATGILASALVAHPLLLALYLPAPTWETLGLSRPEFGVFPVAVCLGVELAVLGAFALLGGCRQSLPRAFAAPFSHDEAGARTSC